MSEFLSPPDSDILGSDFHTASGGNSAADDFDFDRAASAFPDISLDGEGDIPTPAAPPARAPTNGFSFDDFDSSLRETVREVKVTGDDELEKFETEFPELDVPQVSTVDACVLGIGMAVKWQ